MEVNTQTDPHKRTRTLLYFGLIALLMWINITFFLHLSFIEKILVRFPQVVLLLYVYKRWISDSTKPPKFFFTFKNQWLHWATCFLGLATLSGMIILKHIPAYQAGHPEELFRLVPDFVLGIVAIFIPTLGFFSMYYLSSYYAYSMFRLNMWAFDKSKRLLLLIMILDELSITLTSTLIN